MASRSRPCGSIRAGEKQGENVHRHEGVYVVRSAISDRNHLSFEPEPTDRLVDRFFNAAGSTHNDPPCFRHGTKNNRRGFHEHIESAVRLEPGDDSDERRRLRDTELLPQVSMQSMRIEPRGIQSWSDGHNLAGVQGKPFDVTLTKTIGEADQSVGKSNGNP